MHTQVRLGQLDKEAAELREENVKLHGALELAEGAAAANWKAKVWRCYSFPPPSSAIHPLQQDLFSK